MMTDRLPYSRGLRLADIKDLTSRYVSATMQIYAFNEGRNPHVNLIAIDHEIETILDTVQRFDIRNKHHLNLMTVFVSEAAHIERLDPLKMLKRSRKHYISVVDAMCSHITDRSHKRSGGRRDRAHRTA